MRKRTSGTRVVGIAMATILWAAAAAASDPASRCLAATDRAAGVFSQCLLRVESLFARSGSESRRDAGLLKCAGRFEALIARAVASYGEENCTPESLVDSLGTEIAKSAIQVANDAAGRPECVAGVNEICSKSASTGPGTCCGTSACVTDPDNLESDSGICVPIGAGHGSDPNHCYSQKAQTDSWFCEAEWVFCIDAECPTTKWTDDGYEVAECQCWKQTNDDDPLNLVSWLPKGDSRAVGGAPCLMNYPAGETMCNDMKAGQLVSTFRPGPDIPGPSSLAETILAEAAEHFPESELARLDTGNVNYIPPPSSTTCDAKTRWGYCWGARCRECEESDNCANGADVVCDCPLASVSPGYTNLPDGSPAPQPIYVRQDTCTPDPSLNCESIYNGQPATFDYSTRQPVEIAIRCDNGA